MTPMTNGRLAVCESSDWFRWLAVGAVGKETFEDSGVGKKKSSDLMEKECI